MSYTVYFRDSEECLHCLSHRAASESEVLDWFTGNGSPWWRSGPSSQDRRLELSEVLPSGRIGRAVVVEPSPRTLAEKADDGGRLRLAPLSPSPIGWSASRLANRLRLGHPGVE